MSPRIRRMILVLIVAGIVGPYVEPCHAEARRPLERLWRHDAGSEARAEIVAYDSIRGQLLVVNGDQRAVMRLDINTGEEVGPEGLVFIAADQNPLGVACEVGGTTVLFRVHLPR